MIARSDFVEHLEEALEEGGRVVVSHKKNGRWRVQLFVAGTAFVAVGATFAEAATALADRMGWTY